MCRGIRSDDLVRSGLKSLKQSLLFCCEILLALCDARSILSIKERCFVEFYLETMRYPATQEHELFVDQIMQFTFESTFLGDKLFWGVFLAEHVEKIEHPHDCVRVVRWLHSLAGRKK